MIAGKEDQFASVVFQRLRTTAIGKSDFLHAALCSFPVAQYLRPAGRRYKASSEIALLSMEGFRPELECWGSRRGDCGF
jgi:hypothetical protein